MYMYERMKGGKVISFQMAVHCMQVNRTFAEQRLLNREVGQEKNRIEEREKERRAATRKVVSTCTYTEACGFFREKSHANPRSDIRT